MNLTYVALLSLFPLLLVLVTILGLVASINGAMAPDAEDLR
jgi:uncharacterized BrkB/YihY/UPF0761 family membrane protein